MFLYDYLISAYLFLILILVLLYLNPGADPK